MKIIDALLVQLKSPKTAPKKRNTVSDFNLFTIPFKIVPSWRNIPLPAHLPRLEVLFCERIKHHVRFWLNLLYRVNTATHPFLSGEQKELVSSQIQWVVAVRSIDFTNVGKKLLVGVCHVGEPSCCCSTVQVFFVKSSPSDVSELQRSGRISSLTLGDELMVQKLHKFALGCAFELMCLLS